MMIRDSFVGSPSTQLMRMVAPPPGNAAIALSDETTIRACSSAGSGRPGYAWYGAPVAQAAHASRHPTSTIRIMDSAEKNDGVDREKRADRQEHLPAR